MKARLKIQVKKRSKTIINFSLENRQSTESIKKITYLKLPRVNFETLKDTVNFR